MSAPLLGPDVKRLRFLGAVAYACAVFFLIAPSIFAQRIVIPDPLPILVAVGLRALLLGAADSREAIHRLEVRLDESRGQ